MSIITKVQIFVGSNPTSNQSTLTPLPYTSTRGDIEMSLELSFRLNSSSTSTLSPMIRQALTSRLTLTSPSLMFKSLKYKTPTRHVTPRRLRLPRTRSLRISQTLYPRSDSMLLSRLRKRLSEIQMLSLLGEAGLLLTCLRRVWLSMPLPRR